MKKHAVRLNHTLIVLFAVASGAFKVALGAPDVALFAHVGLTPSLVAAFGVLQLVAGLGTIPRVTRVPAALVLVGCNAFATLALFVGGVQPFGAISILFVAMAALVAVPRGNEQPAAAHPTAGTL